MATMENYFYQHRQGTLDTEHWTRMLAVFRFLMATPGGRSWWSSDRVRPDVPFERFLDQEVERIQSWPESEIASVRAGVARASPSGGSGPGR